MESNGRNLDPVETHSSRNSNSSGHEKNSTEKDVFVNHGEKAWHERRREWVGDHHSQQPLKPPREPILSWTTTYEDLLLTTDPFQEPIPLAEMVDFLVDIWYYEEGLYD